MSLEKHEKIFFHGGCHDCTQQKINGIDFCYDCKYFEADWTKPNLNNKKTSKAEIARKEILQRVALREVSNES